MKVNPTFTHKLIFVCPCVTFTVDWALKDQGSGTTVAAKEGFRLRCDGQSVVLCYSVRNLLRGQFDT